MIDTNILQVREFLHQTRRRGYAASQDVMNTWTLNHFSLSIVIHYGYTSLVHSNLIILTVCNILSVKHHVPYLITCLNRNIFQISSCYALFYLALLNLSPLSLYMVFFKNFDSKGILYVYANIAAMLVFTTLNTVLVLYYFAA